MRLSSLSGLSLPMLGWGKAECETRKILIRRVNGPLRYLRKREDSPKIEMRGIKMFNYAGWRRDILWLKRGRIA